MVHTYDPAFGRLPNVGGLPLVRGNPELHKFQNSLARVLGNCLTRWQGGNRDMGFVIEKNNLRETERKLYRMWKHWPLLKLSTGQTATTTAMPTARRSREGVRAVLPLHVLKPPVVLRGLWLSDQKSGMKVACR